MNELETYNSSIGKLIEPERIAYSFNTLGWLIVLGILLLSLALFLLIRWRKYQKNAYRREAITKINNIDQVPQQQHFFLINEILKKTSIQRFGRRKVAPLYGIEWFEFLKSTIASKTVPNYDFESFTMAIYQQDNEIDNKLTQDFTEFALLWLNKHRSNV